MALIPPRPAGLWGHAFVWRLLAGVLAANLLVIAIAGSVLLESRRNDRDEAERTAKNLAWSLSHGVGHLLQQIDMALIATVAEADHLRAIGKPGSSPMTNFMARLYAVLPEADSLRMTDEDGNITLGVGSQVMPKGSVSVADRPYFRQLRENRNAGLVISGVVNGKVSGRPIIVLARRLSHPDGSFAGIVYSSVTLEHLRQTIGQLDVGAHGLVAIRNMALELIVRFPDLGSAAAALGPTPALSRQLEENRTEGMLAATSPLDGVERSMAWRRADEFPFYVFVGLAPEDYLAGWRGEAQRTLLLVLVFLMASLVAAAAVLTSWIRHRRDDDRIRRLSLAVEQSQASVVITDTNGTIEYVNPAFEQTTGYSAAEAIGQNPRILKTDHTPDGEYRHMWETLAGGGTCRMEFLNRRKDGSTYWEDAVLSSVTDDAGRIVNYVAVKEDITERKAAMDSLRESEQRWQFALEGAGDGVWEWNSDGNTTHYSRQWKGMLGYGDDEIGSGQEEWLGRIHPEDLPRVRAKVSQFLAGDDSSYVTEYRMQCKDGNWKWILARGMVVGRDAAGRPTRMIGTHSDITHSKATEEMLREQLDFAESLVNTAQVIILVLDSQGRIVRFNPYLESVSGHPLAEVQGRDWFSTFLPESVRERSRALFLQAINDIQTRGNVTPILTRDGVERPVEWYDKTLKDRQGNTVGLLAVGLDISLRKAAEERVEFLAYHDPVTQLPNRILARDRVNQAVAFAARGGSRVALLYLDLDNFKTINDSFGHVVGDALLKGIAVRLGECVRDSDTVARFGGDEFLVVLTELRGTEHVTAVAAKILEAVASPLSVDSRELYLSASIGIAFFPDDDGSFDGLLQKADTAMYQAKLAGRNTYRFFTEEMNTAAAEHMEMRADLTAALERSEFLLYYQPQVGARKGEVRGVEALIRWRHPRRGLVSPAAFIPVAEASGLIVPIGDWVLREACRQAAAWRAAGLPPITVAVNLSSVQFRRGRLADTVMAALQEAGLPPQWLELELTESILLLGDIHLSETLGRLKAQGVRISIDDFGTGYSNLSYLRHFAVDKLKIDQSFVRNIARSADDMTIVQSILMLARRLKISTIAEGVEEQRQLDYLRIVHCDEIQGYLTGRPMPANELACLLAAPAVTT